MIASVFMVLEQDTRVLHHCQVELTGVLRLFMQRAGGGSVQKWWDWDGGSDIFVESLSMARVDNAQHLDAMCSHQVFVHGIG